MRALRDYRGHHIRLVRNLPPFIHHKQANRHVVYAPITFQEEVYGGDLCGFLQFHHL